jgi:hypothetical protein
MHIGQLITLDSPGIGHISAWVITGFPVVAAGAEYLVTMESIEEEDGGRELTVPAVLLAGLVAGTLHGCADHITASTPAAKRCHTQGTTDARKLSALEARVTALEDAIRDGHGVSFHPSPDFFAPEPRHRFVLRRRDADRA